MKRSFRCLLAGALLMASAGASAWAGSGDLANQVLQPLDKQSGPSLHVSCGAVLFNSAQSMLKMVDHLQEPQREKAFLETVGLYIIGDASLDRVPVSAEVTRKTLERAAAGAFVTFNAPTISEMKLCIGAEKPHFDALSKAEKDQAGKEGWHDATEAAQKAHVDIPMHYFSDAVAHKNF